LVEKRAARPACLSGDLVGGQMSERGRGWQSQQEAETGFQQFLACLLRRGG
jgi:hypothetical protein